MWAARESPCVYVSSSLLGDWLGSSAEEFVAGSEARGVGAEGSAGGLKYSATRSAEAKMEVWMMWILMLSASCGVKETFWDDCCCSSTFRRALVSSRRMDIHSVDLRLLCWKRSIRGVERKREVYCRWSCDLRYSGGRWEGGWLGG